MDWHDSQSKMILHDPVKVDQQRSWMLTFAVCPIIALCVRRGSVCEVLVPGQFAKNTHNSWTVWNIFIKNCEHIDIDKNYPKGIAKWHLSSVEAKLRSLDSLWSCVSPVSLRNVPINLEPLTLEYFDKILQAEIIEASIQRQDI